jgi:hypothetical protein
MKRKTASNHSRLSLALLATSTLLLSGNALANHTVIVEGEQDFDGDGLLGADEDADGDQVFGTISAGVSGVSDNGRVMIVTSGRFFETVTLTGNGVTAVEAAPGVNAVVEAFNGGGDVDMNNARQQAPGIVVDTDGSFPIEIRNLVSRNWTSGIVVKGQSRVTIDNVRADSNVNYGILVKDQAKVAITNSQINGSGFRKSGSLGATPGGDIAPAPGVGIKFQDQSGGYISMTTVAHSFAAGISENGRVQQLKNTVFNNNSGGGGQPCVDTDGDGWGWDGSATCIP